MTMLNQDHAIRHWFLWCVLWVFVTIASCAVGYMVTVGLMILSAHPDATWHYGLLAGFFVSGVAMGCAQWYITRDRMKRAVWWGGATALGRFLGYPIGLVLAQTVLESWWYGNYDSYEMLTMTIGGAVIGLMQWLVLWREVKYAAVWIPISILAWPLGLGAARWAMIQFSGPGGILALGTLEGGIAGLLTGIAMALLLSWAKKS